MTGETPLNIRENNKSVESATRIKGGVIGKEWAMRDPYTEIPHV